MGQLNKAKNIQIAAMNAKGMTVEAIARKAGVDAQTVKESLEQRERTYIELAAMSDEQIKEYIKNLQNKGRSTAEIAELTGYGTKKVNELIFAQKPVLSENQSNENKSEDKSEQELAAMSRKELKEYAVNLYHKGKTRKEIIDITGLSKSSVYLLIPASKGDQKAKSKKKPSQINEEFDKEVDKMIEESKRKEPAPAATDTSSMKNEIKQLCNDDTTKTKESQALEAAKKKLLAIYETLTPDEARAWEMGEVYAEIVRGCE